MKPGTTHLRTHYYGRPDTACGRRHGKEATEDLDKVTCKACRSSRRFQYEETQRFLAAQRKEVE